jgi:arsenite methyltransferase
MPRPSVLPTLLRETFARRTLQREPEPDLVMEGDEQVRAYEEAGRIDSVMSAAYLFHSARATQVVQSAKTVVDLGCGPAVQLGQIARFNPHVQFRGVDLSSRMLEQAQHTLKSQNITNVTLEQADITQLTQIADGSADAVISTMALHHLPRMELLDAAFAEIARILRPGGGVYITDFCRLKSRHSVLYFAYQNQRHFPHLYPFWLDYERSLRAAFLAEDFEAQRSKHLPADVAFHTTMGVPILGVFQTPPKPLPTALAQEVRRLRRQLPWRWRIDLDDMRLFFWLNGMRVDPFSA